LPEKARKKIRRLKVDDVGGIKRVRRQARSELQGTKSVGHLELRGWANQQKERVEKRSMFSKGDLSSETSAMWKRGRGTTMLGATKKGPEPYT